MEPDLEPIFTDLELVESSLRSSLKLRGYLENPRIPFAEKIKTLKGLFKDYISPTAYEFLFLLLRSNTINTLTEILRNYRRTREERGILELEVKTAEPLSPEEKISLAERFSARIGRPLTVKNIVDPEIIGGMVVKMGDILIDASISSKLKRLARFQYG
ncbi:MAG: ATP synthase F1 subunit delta [candidate division WOR-3 bacterium]